MISRRALIQSLAGFGATPSFAQARPRTKKTLVVVFLRGGVDGLALVPPVGDAAYAGLRPSLRLTSPLKLDETFGLHPSMSALMKLFQAKQLAVIHATGLPNSPRSHFEAQDILESGSAGHRAPDGWLNRAGRDFGGEAFSIVAVQNGLPSSMQGESSALAFPSLRDFRLGGTDVAAATFQSLYAQAVDEALRTSGHEAFESVSKVRHEGLSERPPQNGAVWPRSVLARRLQDISRLIHADVGLQLAATELGGFDTHLAQGGETGRFATTVQDLAEALAAFATDLGPKLADVTLLTMTEFGRTARENGTRGTDHGTASASLVLGGGVCGGRVITHWPGLTQLHEGRDLKVTTDLRSVMSECLDAAGIRRADVFPDFTPSKVGLFG
jgi:uncharacterized protein (DUF1501 family)